MFKLGYCYQYQGRCVGRLIHFLNNYCGLGIAESASFGGMGNVTLGDKLFARYTWDDDSDVPTFEFCGENAEYFQQAQAKMKLALIEIEYYERRASAAEKEVAKLREAIKQLEKNTKLNEVVAEDLRKMAKGEPVRGRSAIFCDHANEMPAQCTCDAGCYCRVEGSCRTRSEKVPSYCEHPKEVPNICPCPPDCSCRTEGPCRQ